MEGVSFVREGPRIAGRQVGGGGPALSIRNPATLTTVAEVGSCDASDVELAARTARSAGPAWFGLPSAERRNVLWRLADLIEKNAEDLGFLDTLCTGKVISDSVAEATRTAGTVRFWAGQTDKLFGRQLADVPGRFSFTRVEPLGTYAVIVPWNGPVISFLSRVIPPLACGNAIVAKPSELSPLSALRIADLAAEAGLPAGALNVVTGDGAVGGQLCAHPGVNGVSFTGSVTTGRAVARAAADSFKKVTLELGGKSPILVFEDADLESAALAAIVGIGLNAGQVCAASTRLLVHESVASELEKILVRRAAGLRVGDPFDRDSQIGPVVSQGQYDKVTGYVTEAVAAGARLVVGGETDAERSGLFVHPTILTDLPAGAAVEREEIFGPVLAMRTFCSEAEALELANDSDFGLAAYVWTADSARLLRMIEGIDAGVVHGNTTFTTDAALPFGGFKNSGLGGAYGLEAIDAYTRTKRATIRTAHGSLPSPWPSV